MTNPPQGKHAAPATVKASRGQFYPSLEFVVTTRKLMEAYKRASKGKRGRYGCFRFGEQLGLSLERLKTSILDGSYHPSPCHSFEIFCTAGQKTRLITAPTFSDGVVQHLFYAAVYPVFDRGFIFDSYGCRKGKGTHKAADRVQEFMRKSDDDSYYLQIDVRKYYYSIDHEILRESLDRRIDDTRIVDYMMQFCGEGPVGLNVGCLLSQLYGMIYLDRFDHYCKRILKVKRYVRYVDDIVMIGLSREEAYQVKNLCEIYLRDHLKLELSKWRIAKIKTGINFCGFRTWKERRFVRKRSLHTFTRRLRQRNFVSVASIMAHAIHTTTYGHMLRILKESVSKADLRYLNARLSKALGFSKKQYKKARQKDTRPLKGIKRSKITVDMVRKLRKPF